MTNYEINDVEWARGIGIALENYLDELVDKVYNDEENAFDNTGEPFCGCSTCYTRATVDFLIVETLAAIEAGKIKRVSRFGLRRREK